MTDRPNIYDYLKVIALITMVIDHVGFLLYTDIEILRIIGRVAFPLYLFLVGYNHSYKRKNSLRRRAGILQIGLRGASLLGYLDIYTANILISIGVTRVILGYIQSQELTNQYIYSIAVVSISFLFLPMSLEVFDYGSMCIIYGLLGYRSRTWGTIGKKTYMSATYMLIVLVNIFHIYTSSMYVLGSVDDFYTYMLLIILFLSICMVILSYQNLPLISRNRYINRTILFLSRYALILYVMQIVVIGIIYLISIS